MSSKKWLSTRNKSLNRAFNNQRESRVGPTGRGTTPRPWRTGMKPMKAQMTLFIMMRGRDPPMCPIEVSRLIIRPPQINIIWDKLALPSKSGRKLNSRMHTSTETLDCPRTTPQVLEITFLYQWKTDNLSSFGLMLMKRTMDQKFSFSERFTYLNKIIINHAASSSKECKESFMPCPSLRFPESFWARKKNKNIF